MDRIALAKRLESFSSVFASHTPYNRDLRAMSYVLSKMDDVKFKSVLSGEFSPDDLDACMFGRGTGAGPLSKVIPLEDPSDLPIKEDKKIIVIDNEEGLPMSTEANEKTAGTFWCKEASKVVVDNLLRDVIGMNKSVCCDTGSKLGPKQVPDGKHDGEKAKTLTPEQTPDDAASIKTDMVKKSQSPAQKEAGDKNGPGIPDKDGKGPKGGTPECPKNDEKEAGSKKGPGIPDGTGPCSGTPECQMSDDKKEKEASLADIEKAKKKKEEAKVRKDLESLKKSQKEQNKKDATSSSSNFEGIELVASMDEAVLDADEADKLSQLFE